MKRKLTPREKKLRRRYTRIVCCGYRFGVSLVVDHQSFTVNDSYPLKQEAEWLRDMLAIALARIEP